MTSFWAVFRMWQAYHELLAAGDDMKRLRMVARSVVLIPVALTLLSAQAPTSYQAYAKFVSPDDFAFLPVRPTFPPYIMVLVRPTGTTHFILSVRIVFAGQGIPDRIFFLYPTAATLDTCSSYECCLLDGEWRMFTVRLLPGQIVSKVHTSVVAESEAQDIPLSKPASP